LRRPAPYGLEQAMNRLLQQALASHQSGNLAEAERLYLQLMQADPQEASAPHLLGVVRAQQVVPGYLPHFSLLGLATAGRDDGGHRFEREAVAEHVRAVAAGLAAAGFDAIQLALTPLTPAGRTIASAVGELLAAAPLPALPLDVVIDDEREAGRGYYRELCFKVNVRDGAEWAEVGDGGFTDWTARLTASSKERLLISGIGIDRVATLGSEIR